MVQLPKVFIDRVKLMSLASKDLMYLIIIDYECMVLNIFWCKKFCYLFKAGSKEVYDSSIVSRFGLAFEVNLDKRVLIYSTSYKVEVSEKATEKDCP